VFAVAGTPNAHAQASCREHVVADWAAGWLGPGYAVACYRAALAHLPDDVRIYSSAEDDIRRAMLAAVEARATQAVAASTPRREPAARRAPAATRPTAARLRRPEAAAKTAQSLVPETTSNRDRRSVAVLLAVVVAGILALWLAAARTYRARRGRRT
jgi:hypothetical protein